MNLTEEAVTIRSTAEGCVETPYHLVQNIDVITMKETIVIKVKDTVVITMAMLSSYMTVTMVTVTEDGAILSLRIGTWKKETSTKVRDCAHLELDLGHSSCV